MSVTERLLRPLLRTSSARPLITHYDHATDSRVELSVATLANWAAKTANWLTEEVDVEPGDKVAARLPAHWQTAGILLGAWWCGAHVVNESEDTRISFVSLENALELSVSKPPTAIVSLDPMGRSLSQLPPERSAAFHELPSAIDFLTEVRVAGDEYFPMVEIPGDTPALLSYTVDDLLAAASESATREGISQQDRVLSTIEWNFPEGLVDTLLATLSTGAHLVQISHPDKEKMHACQQSERTTVTLSQ